MDYGTSDIVKLLKTKDIEIGYGVLSMIGDEEIEYEAIRRGEMKLIVSSEHPFAKLSKIPIECLENKQIIMYNPGTTYTEKLLLEHMKQAGIASRIFYVREQSTVFDMVAQNFGIAAVLDEHISVIRDNPHIEAREFEEPIFFETGLLWSKNHYLSSSARKLQAFIKNRDHDSE